jgi:pimeloyl-ACP methyl ester carboxylesterase
LIPLKSQFLQVNDLNIRFVDMGSGRTVLLLHGLGGSIESWTNNIHPLSSRLRVIALDLPGFGLSDKPKISYSIKFYTDFVAAFAKRLKLKSASVIGSSLGGQIAAEFALRRQSAVDKLVLISPAGALPTSFKGTSALKKYIKVTAAKSFQQTKRALFAVDNNPVKDAYAALVYKRITLPGAKEAFLSALNGSALAPRLTKRLNGIKAPTLLLWGKDDAMIPSEFVTPYMKMDSCRIIMLERCGHRPHVERPGLFNKIVTDFVMEC